MEVLLDQELPPLVSQVLQVAQCPGMAMEMLLYNLFSLTNKKDPITDSATFN